MPELEQKRYVGLNKLDLYRAAQGTLQYIYTVYILCVFLLLCIH